MTLDRALSDRPYSLLCDSLWMIPIQGADFQALSDIYTKSEALPCFPGYIHHQPTSQTISSPAAVQLHILSILDNIKLHYDTNAITSTLDQ